MSGRSAARLYALLVEPSRAQSHAVIAQLESLGVTDYSTVTSGAAALESCAEAPPDLVLSARELPDMSGAELLVALGSEPPGDAEGRTPVSALLEEPVDSTAVRLVIETALAA